MVLALGGVWGYCIVGDWDAAGWYACMVNEFKLGNNRRLAASLTFMTIRCTSQKVPKSLVGTNFSELQIATLFEVRATMLDTFQLITNVVYRPRHSGHLTVPAWI